MNIVRSFLKTAAFIALAVFLAFMFSSCSSKLVSMEDSMRPPKLTGANAALQTAFESKFGTQAVLKYPVSGNYRSAFVVCDIDGDGVDEAFVFYTDTAIDTVVNIGMLSPDGEGWSFVTSLSGAGSDVYAVDFRDLDGDGAYELLVSWSLYDTKAAKVLSVYECLPGSGINMLSGEAYTVCKILDMDGDKLDEIFLVLLDNSAEPQTSTGKLLKMQEGEINLIGETKLDGNVSGYANISADKVSLDTPMRLFIDAYKGETQMITEVVYWDKSVNTIVNPLFDIGTQSNVRTRRSIHVNCTDVDNDGAIEIPVSAMGQSSPNAAASVGEVLSILTESSSAQIINWSTLSGATLVPARQTLINSTDGYMLTVPEEFKDKLSVGIDGSTGECEVMLRDISSKNHGEVLFALKLLTGKETQSSGYEYTVTLDKRKIAFTVTDVGESVGITSDMISVGLTGIKGE